MPHSPVLIPSLGKEHFEKTQNTISAIGEITRNLSSNEVDTLFFITPHGSTLNPRYYTLLVGSPEYPEELHADFSSFGDFSTPFVSRCSAELIGKILSINAPFTINAIADKTLDYGTSVPLSYIRSSLPSAKVVTLGVSGDNNEMDMELGRSLFNIMQESNEKIGVICSIDLAHSQENALNKKNIFDQMILDFLAQGCCEKISSINPMIIEEARSCAFHPLLILSGLLEQINYSYRFINYESPVGVGYLCADYTIPHL